MQAMIRATENLKIPYKFEQNWVSTEPKTTDQKLLYPANRPQFPQLNCCTVGPKLTQL